MSNLQNTRFPSARDIFNQFELTEQVTARYEELQKQLDKIIKRKFTTFEERDEIDYLVIANCAEAQTMGFEQGFQIAVKLLVTGGQI